MSYQDTYVYGKLVYDTNGGGAGGETIIYVIIKFAGITGAGSAKFSDTALPNFTNYTTGHTNLPAYNTNNLALLCANQHSTDANNTVAAGALELWQIITSATLTPATNATGTTHFQNVNFAGVNFTNCVFNNGNTANPTANPVVAVLTNFTNCSFDGATLAVSLKYSTFAGCNMAGATLTGANLQGADFSNAKNTLAIAGLAAGLNVDNQQNNSALITLPDFSPIVISNNSKTLTYTAPTAVTVDASLAGGALTAVASPSGSIPAGVITINTTTNVITNANVGGNIGRLIPLNVLKLARAVNCVLNIQ